PYHSVARDYKPDHIAILPDRIGACSIADGCGVNNAGQQFSHEQLRRLLDEKVAASYSVGPKGDVFNPDQYLHAYVVDVFDKKVVYRLADKLFQVGYVTDLRNNTVELSGEPVEVRRLVAYKPVTNGQDPEPNHN